MQANCTKQLLRKKQLLHKKGFVQKGLTLKIWHFSSEHLLVSRTKNLTWGGQWPGWKPKSRWKVSADCHCSPLIMSIIVLQSHLFSKNEKSIIVMCSRWNYWTHPVGSLTSCKTFWKRFSLFSSPLCALLLLISLNISWLWSMLKP